MRKVYGVGVNDLSGSSKVIDGKRVYCPYYDRWKSMLRRCYSEQFKKKNKAYDEVTVCQEWLTFSNFKSWMEKQDWQGKHLDKDLLTNDGMYGPEQCVFIDSDVNTFIIQKRKDKGLPIGVYVSKSPGKYAAYTSYNNKTIYIGSTYDTVEQAQLAYNAYRAQLAIDLAGKQSNPIISKALLDRYVTNVYESVAA